ncbi:MAG: proton-conducting transporter membrane subunit, partial [Gemmataceae bacterium]
MSFGDHPGLFFVAATLMPALSLAILLLTGFLRKVVRARQADSPTCASFYQTLGGDRPGKGAAYVATAAIGLAFVFSFIGFLHFAADMRAKEELEHKIAHGGHDEHDHKPGEAHVHEPSAEMAKLEAIERRWQGHVDWADIALNPPDEHGHEAGAEEHEHEHEKPASILTLGYHIDNLSVVMFLMVTFIATLIHIFSIGYMAEEDADVVEDHQVHTADGHLKRKGRFGRFFLYLSFFSFSMLNLILADNLFQVFLSWELVGICSYLLIGFYFERQSASNAANKAFITNRVGDAGFVIGLLILWTYVGTFNFQEINERVRAPFQDAHGKRLKLSGQIVRGHAIDETEDGSNFRIDPHGDQVLLFTPTMHVHFDELDPGDAV